MTHTGAAPRPDHDSILDSEPEPDDSLAPRVQACSKMIIFPAVARPRQSPRSRKTLIYWSNHLPTPNQRVTEPFPCTIPVSMGNIRPSRYLIRRRILHHTS